VTEDKSIIDWVCGLLYIWLVHISVSAMPGKAHRMNIFVAIMFLLPLVLVTLYLYLSGAFTNRRAFQYTFFILLAFFGLTIGICTQLPYLGYNLPTTTPLSLSKVLPQP